MFLTNSKLKYLNSKLCFRKYLHEHLLSQLENIPGTSVAVNTIDLFQLILNS